MTSTQPGVQPGANPKRTRARAAIALAIVLAILGYLLWQQLRPVSQSAPAVSQTVARVVSAPASAASATAQVVRPAVAPAAVEAKTYTVKPGDTLGTRFGKNWKPVCDLNAELLKGNCNHLEIGWVLKLPEGVEPLEDQVQPVKRAAKKALKAEVPQPTNTGEFLWKKVGGAPLRGCGNKDAATINEEAWADYIRQGLMTEAERAELRELTRGMTEPNILLTSSEGRVELKPGDRFTAVSFCSKNGQATSRTNVLAAWDAEKTGPVFAQSFKLKSSVPDDDGMVTEWLWVRTCHNWAPRKVKQPAVPKLAPPPTPEPLPPLPPTPPASAPELPLAPPPALPPVEQQVAARYDDWDLGFYAGGDRDVVYAGGEGAYYPGEGIFWRNWGRYAVGVGAFGNLWDGQTPQDYSFGGRYGAIGLSQKWSTYERRDVGIKFPMIGAFSEYGHDSTGKYRESRHAKILCASASYNDASREKAGETSIPEWQLWTSLCDPISQSKSHSWDGQALNTADMKDIRHIVSVGGRVFLTKDLTGLLGNDSAAGKKLQPFVEVGANKTSPFPYSAHAYLGLRTVDKVWGCGVGPHYSDATNTTIAGFTCTYDAGRHYKLGVEQERWTAMVTSLKALGVNVADD